MKVRASWKSINPFRPNVDELGYTKTVEIPDGTDLKEIEQLAKDDSKNGYRFDKIEVLLTNPTPNE